MRPLFLSRLLICFFALSAQAGAALTVDFEQNPALPLVTVSILLPAGASYDPPAALGLNNFMGEMLLRGTKKKNKRQFDQALDLMGAQIDVDTRAEAMIIRGTCLSSQLTPFLNLIQEILTEPSFDPSEISKLKRELSAGLLEELGHDGSLSDRRFQKILFLDHPYGNPILGDLPSLKALSRKQIETQYEKFVRPEFLSMMGSGDADPEQLQKWADGLIQKLSPHSPKKEKESSDLQAMPLPQPRARKLWIIDKPNRTQTQIHVGQIGLLMGDPRFFPLTVANSAFGEGFASRLMQEIRVKRGWSYGADSQFRFGRQPRYWKVHLFPAEKDTAEALKKTVELITELQTGNLQKEEFEQSKVSLVQGAAFIGNTPQKRMENRILEKMLDLPRGFFSSYADHLDSVSLSASNEALRTFIHPNQLLITVLGTASRLKKPLQEALGLNDADVIVIPYQQEKIP